MNTSTSHTIIVALRRVSTVVYTMLFALIPIFFLPITTEFFEFNKLYLLIASVILLVILTAVRAALGDKVELIKSPLDFPIVLALSILILATIFSLDKNSSIYGEYGRWFPGLFSGITLLVFFYIGTPLIKSLKSVSTVSKLLLAAVTLSSFVSVLSYYGINPTNFSFLKNPAFSMAGSITASVLLATIGFISGLVFLNTGRKLPDKVSSVTAIIINFFYLAITGTTFGWILSIVGVLALTVTMKLRKSPGNTFSFLLTAGVIFGIMAITLVPTTRSVMINSNFPKEIQLNLKESWGITTATVRDYPLLGTGPSTFYLNYPRYKSLSQNMSSNWMVNFDKPANEVLNVLGNFGLLGLLALILFSLALIKILKEGISLARSQDELVIPTVLNTFLLLGLLGQLIASYALAGNIETVRGFSMELTMLANTSSLWQDSEAIIRKEHFKYIVMAPLLALTGYFGFLQIKAYSAEYYMRKSVVAATQNDASKMYDSQQKAIILNPKRENYQLSYAQTNILLANVIAGKESLSSEDENTIKNLVSQAIKSSQNATEKTNPFNSQGWLVRAGIYRNLTTTAENAAELALQSYNTALQLDPTNPKIRLDIGVIFFSKKDYLSAANQFRQATNLKPDYANAHYNFAQALVMLEDYANAKREMEIVQKLVAPESGDSTKVQEELAAIDQKLQQVAGATTQKPTVEEISGSTESTAPQEQLVKVGEESIDQIK